MGRKLRDAEASGLRLERYSRIHVTGNAGAGKTTTARRLGKRLGLPVHSLDSIVWRPGWRKTPMSLRGSLECELTSGPRWVIDGVSRRVRDAADLVVFLDTPTAVCMARATLRTLRHLRRQRPDLPEGCPEWRIYPRLLGLICRFEARVGADIRQEADRNPRYWVGSTKGLDALLGGR